VPVPGYDGTAYIGFPGPVTEANGGSDRRVAPLGNAPSPVRLRPVTHSA